MLMLRTITIGCLVLGCVVQLPAQPKGLAYYKAVFTTPPANLPTAKTPDAPLAGNGDIGLTFGGTPDHLRLYLGKNDFWRAYPVYPGGGIAFPGALDIESAELKDASYYAAQLPDKACIDAEFKKNGLQLNVTAWVTATHNTVVTELTANKACTLQLKLWAAQGNTAVTDAGNTKGVQWVTRSFENTPLLEWPCKIAMAMKVLGAASVTDQSVTLTPGKKAMITVTLYTNQDKENWKQVAIETAAALTENNITAMHREHEKWWAHFWQRSSVQIGDSLLEKYYYASQYLFACTSRGDKFAPGIWGPFVTKDSAAWGGDYHLNYNYQAPFWAAYSSNYIDLVDNYDQPLLDYMNKGKWHAEDLLHSKGIYYPVGIGPKGLCTTRWPLTPEEMLQRYATTENTIDHGYKFLGQKINAVFSAGNMLMRFYSTYDEAYAQRVYPYLIECTNFWEDYLKLQDGRYVIEMDHYGEVMPNLRNKGQWRDQLGDFNSTLSLGLVKMLFKGMINVSEFLQRDAARIEKWKYILAHLSDFPIGEVDGRKSLKSVEKSPAAWHSRPMGLARVSIHGLLLPGGVCGPRTDPAFNKILLSDIQHWKDKMQRPGEWGNTLGNGMETCFPGAARVGYDPDDLLKQLKDRIHLQSLRNLWITQEGGGIETLAAVPLTINEMLLQSYEGVVRVFPDWDHARDASFQYLRAYGAFVVSSSLKKGRVEWVKIESEKGRTCTMDNPWTGHQVQLIRNGKKAEQLSGDTWQFTTGIHEKLELYSL